MARQKKPGKRNRPSATAPVAASVRITERAGVAVFAAWMREIIGDENFDLGAPDVDTSGDDRKSPDLVVYSTARTEKVLCLIEFKLPDQDASDEELKQTAFEKARRREAPFFGACNFRQLYWYSTERCAQMADPWDQILNIFAISDVEDVKVIAPLGN
jgi:hypothetical protein